MKIGIVIFLILFQSLNISAIANAQTFNLEVEVSTNFLLSESLNDIIVMIYNDFEPIFELVVSMSFSESTQDSSSLNIIGTHSWKFDKVLKGGSVEIPLIVFVPEGTEGKAYTANIDLTYKRLGYVSEITENHSIGFYIPEEEEYIDLVLYEVEVDPVAPQPGVSITFSASTLNKGNIPAMYVNVSLIENSVLTLQSESYSYLGQIDPNSPTAFSLDALINPRAREGSYSAEINIKYEDEENRSYTIHKQIPFNIVMLREERTTQGPLGGIFDPILNIIYPSSSTRPVGPPATGGYPGRSPTASTGTFQNSYPILAYLPIIIVILVIIGVIALVRRRSSSKKQLFEDALEEKFED